MNTEHTNQPRQAANAAFEQWWQRHGLEDPMDDEDRYYITASSWARRGYLAAMQAQLAEPAACAVCNGTGIDVQFGDADDAIEQPCFACATQPPAVAVAPALPDWMECDAKVQAGTANALERFIAANEPAGDSAAEFRAALLAILAAAPQAAVPNEVAKDAARYRWLRQDESEFSSMAPAELDAAIDKAIAAAQKGGAA